jgi:hypothetical protein
LLTRCPQGLCDEEREEVVNEIRKRGGTSHPVSWCGVTMSLHEARQWSLVALDHGSIVSPPHRAKQDGNDWNEMTGGNLCGGG